MLITDCQLPNDRPRLVCKLGICKHTAISIILFSAQLADVLPQCCRLGRQWATQSHLLCGPYPVEMIPAAMALMDDVTRAMLCTTTIDACCVIHRGAIQCEAGRQTALNELSCHGLHFYQDAEDAKVTVAWATVFRESDRPV